MAASSILGPDGRPMQRQQLLTEQAAPSLTSVRTISSGHPADGLTPQRLVRILREAETGDAVAYLELAEQMEEKNLHYLGVLGHRKRGVAQLDLTTEPPSTSANDKAVAELVRQFVRRLELQGELLDLLDAIGKGFAVCEILWDTSEGQWMPRALVSRDQRWFQYSLEDGRTLQLWTNDGLAPLAPNQFIVHESRAKSGLPIRGGLARAAAWAHLFKTASLKDWLEFADGFGRPYPLGKYGPGATEIDRATLARAIRNVGIDGGAMIPDGMALELIQAQVGGNSQLYLDLLSYLDQQVSKAVLGNTGTSDAIAGGHAVGRTHRAVELDIQCSDARQLEVTLNRDLVRPLVALNFGPQAAYPILRIVVGEEQDALQLAQALAPLIDRGLVVGQSAVRAIVGIDEPQPGEAVLRPAPSGAAPAPVDPVDDAGDDADTAVQAALPAPGIAETDAIDATIDEQLADWHPLIAPILQPVQDLLARSSSYAEVIAGLPALIPQQNVQALADVLAKCLFAARLRGETEEDLG